MRLKKFRTAAIIAVGMSLASLATAQSASAGQARTVTYDGIEVQIDNNPGNNEAAWLWAWKPANETQRVDVWIKYYDGSVDPFAVHPRSGQGIVQIFNQDVYEVEICPNIPPNYLCSGYQYGS